MRSLADVTLNFIESSEDAEAFLRWLSERREVLCMDLETPGLRWWLPGFKIRLGQFGDYDTSWTMRADRHGALIEKVAAEYRGQKTGQNFFGFDMHCLASCGFTLPRWHEVDDTLMMSKLCEGWEWDHSLEGIIKRHIGKEALFAKKILDEAFEAHGFRPNTKDQMAQERMWTEIPYEAGAYTIYSGMDTISGARAWKYYRPIIDANFRDAYTRKMGAWQVVWEQEHAGLPVDVPYTKKLGEEMDRDIALVLSQLSELGIDKPGNRAQKMEKLQQDGWIPEVFTKKTKLPQLNKSILEGIASDVVVPLLEYQRLTKWKSSYVDAVLRTQYNGRVYPSVSPHGAKTGRHSARNPPIHQMPAKHEDAPKIRRMFLPEPGEKLVSIDYNAQENRLLYHFSRDKALKRIFDEGLDIHTYTAAAIFGVRYEHVTHEQRSIAKTFNYAAAYGAMDKKLASGLGMHESDIPAIRERVNGAFSGVAAYSKGLYDRVETMLAAGERPYVESWGGRHLYPDAKYIKGELYCPEAINYPNQGTGGDVLDEALNRFAAADLSHYVKLNVHDEVIASVPDGPEGEAIADELAKTMAFTNGEFAIDLTTSRGALTDYWGGH